MKKEILRFWQVCGAYHFYHEDYVISYSSYERAKEQFDHNSCTDDETTLKEWIVLEEDGIIDFDIIVLERKRKNENS